MLHKFMTTQRSMPWWRHSRRARLSGCPYQDVVEACHKTVVPSEQESMAQAISGCENETYEWEVPGIS